jgi:hypothetical protein
MFNLEIALDQYQALQDETPPGIAHKTAGEING